MVLLTVIAVSTLLVAVVGATFAYFTATVNDTYSSGGNGNTEIKSATVASTMTFAQASEGAGSFTAEDVYPGHKEVAVVKVTAEGTEGSQSAVRLTYTASQNDFAEDDIKISVYRKDDTEISFTNSNNPFSCAKTSGSLVDGDGNTKLYETCNETAATLAGASQKGSTVTAPTSSSKIIMDSDVITISESSKTVYYYVVLEFENKESSQNTTSSGKTLKGEITVTAV